MYKIIYCISILNYFLYTSINSKFVCTICIHTTFNKVLVGASYYMLEINSVYLLNFVNVCLQHLQISDFNLGMCYYHLKFN